MHTILLDQIPFVKDIQALGDPFCSFLEDYSSMPVAGNNTIIGNQQGFNNKYNLWVTNLSTGC